MQRRRKIVECEPLNGFEFVRFPITNFVWVDPDSEIKSNPVGWTVRALPVHTTVSEELMLKHISAIFLGYLLA